MFGIDRYAARAVWTVALVLLLLALVYLVRKTLFVFIVALLLAYLLSPLVDLLDRLGPRRRTRTAALSAAYAILILGVVLIGQQIGSRVVEEANSLSRKAPQMLAQWEKAANEPGAPADSLRQQLAGRVRGEFSRWSSDLFAELPKVGIRLLGLASDLVYVVIVPILAFFFLKDGHVIREHILALVDEGPRRMLVDDVLADVHLLLAHYMRAVVLLSCATFVTYSIFFAIIGVPYGILLATTAFLLEFIPMLGPLTASVIIVVVALVSGGQPLVVLIFLLAYRMFQDYVLSPHVMGTGVELHPLLVLFGVFAGAEVAGIPGAFLSVPVLALVRILYFRMRKARAARTIAV